MHLHTKTRSVTGFTSTAKSSQENAFELAELQRYHKHWLDLAHILELHAHARTGLLCLLCPCRGKRLELVIPAASLHSSVVVCRPPPSDKGLSMRAKM